MKISCLQMNVLFEKPDENFAHAKELIKKAAECGTDTIILPETWNTGFFPKNNPESFCDTDGIRVKNEIGILAGRYNINIVAGSVSNLKNGKVYNTAYVFSRDGECVAAYDKTHLFTPMREDDYYQKGDHLCRFELDGNSCAVLICYDIRFPELTRTLSVQGLDFLFLVSQWPKVRISHILALTKARAIENQIFVANCNSCGTAGESVYGGNSSVHDPCGETLVLAGEHEEIITADCDISVLKDIRKSINVFSDRRVELYNL